MLYYKTINILKDNSLILHVYKHISFLNGILPSVNDNGSDSYNIPFFIPLPFRYPKCVSNVLNSRECSKPKNNK